MTVDDLDMLDAIINAYGQRHGSGGSIHVFFDDRNCNRETLLFCQQTARNRDDSVGEAIATLLLRAPDKIIEECEIGWPAAYAMWLAIIEKNQPS